MQKIILGLTKGQDPHEMIKGVTRLLKSGLAKTEPSFSPLFDFITIDYSQN